MLEDNKISFLLLLLNIYIKYFILESNIFLHDPVKHSAL